MKTESSNKENNSINFFLGLSSRALSVMTGGMSKRVLGTSGSVHPVSEKDFLSAVPNFDASVNVPPPEEKAVLSPTPPVTPVSHKKSLKNTGVQSILKGLGFGEAAIEKDMPLPPTPPTTPEGESRKKISMPPIKFEQEERLIAELEAAQGVNFKPHRKQYNFSTVRVVIGAINKVVLNYLDYFPSVHDEDIYEKNKIVLRHIREITEKFYYDILSADSDQRYKALIQTFYKEIWQQSIVFSKADSTKSFLLGSLFRDFITFLTRTYIFDKASFTHCVEGSIEMERYMRSRREQFSNLNEKLSAPFQKKKRMPSEEQIRLKSALCDGAKILKIFELAEQEIEREMSKVPRRLSVQLVFDRLMEVGLVRLNNSENKRERALDIMHYLFKDELHYIVLLQELVKIEKGCYSGDKLEELHVFFKEQVAQKQVFDLQSTQDKIDALSPVVLSSQPIAESTLGCGTPIASVGSGDTDEESQSNMEASDSTAALETTDDTFVEEFEDEFFEVKGICSGRSSYDHLFDAIDNDEDGDRVKVPQTLTNFFSSSNSVSKLSDTPISSVESSDTEGDSDSSTEASEVDSTYSSGSECGESEVSESNSEDGESPESESDSDNEDYHSRPCF